MMWFARMPTFNSRIVFVSFLKILFTLNESSATSRWQKTWHPGHRYSLRHGCSLSSGLVIVFWLGNFLISGSLSVVLIISPQLICPQVIGT